MTSPSPFERLKGVRVGRIVLVYLGASWVVLQLVDTLQDLLSLPPVVGPLTVVLLLVGLVVVSATAWVQSLTSTTEAEDAGQVPTDWEIAPREAMGSLKAGQLPHLTWGRALAGGAVAFALLLGGAALYAVFSGGTSPLSPSPAGATGIADGVAVLPFSVSGAELEVYREGMVDLLSSNLDGVGGLRTIDSRTVLARWDETVDGAERPDLETSLSVAARTEARYAVLGSMVAAGPQVRLDVELFDLADGSEMGTARIEGSPDDILSLVDGLSVGIARELFGADADRVANEQRVESINTESLDALNHYLDGEQALRGGDFPMAEAAFVRATEADSLFALAWARLASTRGWMPGGSGAARDVSVGLMDRLSPREATLVDAIRRYNEFDPSGLSLLEDFLLRYPDVADAWYTLGDQYFHRTYLDPISRDSAVAIISRGAEIDPGFAPYFIHPIDYALAAADSSAAARLMEGYRSAGGVVENLRYRTWAACFDVLFSQSPETESTNPCPIHGFFGATTLQAFEPGRYLAPAAAQYEAHPDDDGYGALYAAALLAAGALSGLEDLVASRPPIRPTVLAGLLVTGETAFGADFGESTHRALENMTCDPNLGIFCLGPDLTRVRHASAVGHLDEARAAMARLDSVAADPPDIEFLTAHRAAELARGESVAARATFEGRHGDPATALSLWRSIEGAEATDYLETALAAERAGDLAEAERFYALAADWQLRSVALFKLARLYEQQGRTDEALTQYRKAIATWEAADPDLPDLIAAQDAVSRLSAQP